MSHAARSLSLALLVPLLWGAPPAVLAQTRPVIRVLIFTGQNNHNWRETTPKLQAILEAGGRFAVAVTEHPEQCDAATLAKYDVLVSDWNTWGKPAGTNWPDATRGAFLDFVRNGKGFVAVHAGSSSFFDWAEYQQVAGAWWRLGKTGHGAPHRFTVKPVADHPITRGVQPFSTTDELWLKPGVHPAATVLATGDDQPVALVTQFGKGRGFTLLLGHSAAFMDSPGFQALLARGAEWAATGQVTPRDVLKPLASHQYGPNRAILREVAALVQTAPRETAPKLAALLELDATLDCKKFVCEQLDLIGTAAEAPGDEPFPAGWQGVAPREEIRPSFAFDARGGPQGNGAFVIATGAAVGQHGWFQKAFPVTGGRSYRFEAARQVANVAAPRRCAPVRIVWQDSAGKAVPADPPAGREKEAGPIPVAEPEHPLDGPADPAGWTSVAGVYRAPAKATQAVVELHLQWAPRGRVAWSAVTFAETPPRPSRKVRLATVHYTPSGKSPRTNCEEYAPLIAGAAQQKANLVVLGETVPYVRTGKKPHEIAESVPGPTTEYFGELARKHQLHVVLSLYEREETVVYNTAVLLGPDAQLIGKYRKVCLPHSEIEAGVAPGDSYPVFATSLGKVAMMICYDGFFPEVARELTNRGAEIIAWPVWGCNPLLAQARACENHVYVVSSTYTDAKSNWMISAVFDHAGKPIAKADRWGQVAVAEVDLSERYFWRNNLGDFHAMAQRHRPVPTPEPVTAPPPAAPRAEK